MSTLLVSDHEREYTVGLLRGHLLSGRLTTEEFEQRVAEAWSARHAHELWQALRWLPTEEPRAGHADRGSGVAGLVVGLVGLCLLVLTFGLAFPIALPLFVTAWALGRGGHGPAAGARIIGVVGTTVCLLYFAGCVAVVA